MEKLELIRKALERANQRGVFTLEESAVVFEAVSSLAEQLTPVDKKEATKKATK